MKIDSQVVHAGDRKRGTNVAVPSTTPISLGTTFFYESAEKLDRVMGNEEPGFSYSRYGNPTSEALEQLLTNLENGAGSLATASGMAAIQLAVQTALLDRRRSILASNALYGATIKMFDQLFGGFGVEVTYTDCCEIERVRAKVAEQQPGVIFLESISNPLMRVADLAAIAEIARSAGAALVVDNTFATPLMVKPLNCGAHLVVHSLTKYLSGHGDVLGGAIISDSEHNETLHAISRTAGPVLGPFESYLTMRGIKTLALRFERQCRNAAAIAEWLRMDDRVERVYHCSQQDHPDSAVIQRLFRIDLRSAILSFEINGAERKDILRFMDRLKMIVPGTSLGDVHSLLLYPAMASHRDLSPKGRSRMGIKDNLVRLAAGIEAEEDIRGDLNQALER
jgi:cystathionine gamma-synthase/methionine-gamma-lyase